MQNNCSLDTCGLFAYAYFKSYKQKYYHDPHPPALEALSRTTASTRNSSDEPRLCVSVQRRDTCGRAAQALGDEHRACICRAYYPPSTPAGTRSSYIPRVWVPEHGIFAD